MSRARRSNRSQFTTSAQIDALESRRMFNAATLKHGLLTVYGSDDANTITISSPTTRLVEVNIDGAKFDFRSTGILRMRVFGFGDNDTITLGDTYTPNMGDVSIDAGDGNDTVTENSLGHRYNRALSVSVLGGAGNDTLAGGAHTFSLDGGVDDDVLYGGAAGANLNGNDGNDLVSANQLSIINTLSRQASAHNALGGVGLSGGAGDDFIVGNSQQLLNTQETIAGGSGDDAIFNFSTDTIVDLGQGIDTQPANNQFAGNADVTQTATLSYLPPQAQNPIFPVQGLGNNGPKSSIAVTDASGTVTMQGPMGSTFLLGDLLNASGYPVDKLGIPASVVLTVNGFVSSLTGNQIAGYQINNGDVIQLGGTGLI